MKQCYSCPSQPDLLCFSVVVPDFQTCQLRKTEYSSPKLGYLVYRKAQREPSHKGVIEGWMNVSLVTLMRMTALLWCTAVDGQIGMTSLVKIDVVCNFGLLNC
jgi:hypothetical protein